MYSQTCDLRLRLRCYFMLDMESENQNTVVVVGKWFLFEDDRLLGFDCISESNITTCASNESYEIRP